jgi:hypothetical protein
MPRNYVIQRVGSAQKNVIAGNHVTHIEDNREGVVQPHIIVIVGCIGSQHHPTTLRENSNRL